MLEYKVKFVADREDAEEMMNDMAREGWRVTDVTYWNRWTVGLMITFERER